MGKLVAYFKDTETGDIAVEGTDYPWTELNEDSVNGAVYYYTGGGNWSCDCNRGSVFNLNLPCGHERIECIRIDIEGVTVWEDGEQLYPPSWSIEPNHWSTTNK